VFMLVVNAATTTRWTSHVVKLLIKNMVAGCVYVCSSNLWKHDNIDDSQFTEKMRGKFHLYRVSSFINLILAHTLN
jgi:hypothetical protein